MIPIACKITNFSLHLFVYFFENIANNFGWLNCAYHIARKNGWHAPQGLIIGTPISQYASYTTFCLLHSNINKEQHEKHLCNPSNAESGISPLSVRDRFRLGKYREHSRQPCPILVKLNRAIDRSQLLHKARKLTGNIKIKPDLSYQERLVQSILLRIWTVAADSARNRMHDQI